MGHLANEECLPRSACARHGQTRNRQVSGIAAIFNKQSDCGNFIPCPDIQWDGFNQLAIRTELGSKRVIWIDKIFRKWNRANIQIVFRSKRNQSQIGIVVPKPFTGVSNDTPRTTALGVCSDNNRPNYISFDGMARCHDVVNKRALRNFKSHQKPSGHRNDFCLPVDQPFTANKHHAAQHFRRNSHLPAPKNFSPIIGDCASLSHYLLTQMVCHIGMGFQMAKLPLWAIRALNQTKTPKSLPRHLQRLGLKRNRKG